MKKLFSLLLAITIIFGSMSIAYAEYGVLSEFDITSDGVVNAYYGDEWLEIPSEIDGIPVKKIGERACMDLGINYALMNDGLEEIGYGAFEGSNIQSTDIPSTVTVIDDYAYANCANLVTVYLNGDENIVIGENAFTGTPHITFYTNCTTDVEKLTEKIAYAKGDDYFEITLTHPNSHEYTDAETQAHTVWCEDCDYTETYYTPAQHAPFLDVPSHMWYHDYVLSAYNLGILNGKSENIFDPDAGMTCGEAAKIAACVYAVQISIDMDIDTTVKDGGAWYDPYVEYCYANGIIEGHISFDWEAPITRAQMAYVFSRADKSNLYINDVPLTDIPDVTHETPFSHEILDLYNRGVAVGNGDYSFNPDSQIKRCEAAALITRILFWDTRIELPKG